MKLSIDTQMDSKEDLRKVIRFLQLVVNEHRDYSRANADRSRMDELSSLNNIDSLNDLGAMDHLNSLSANNAPKQDSLPPPVPNGLFDMFDNKKEQPKKDFKLDFF